MLVELSMFVEKLNSVINETTRENEREREKPSCVKIILFDL